MSTRTRIAPYKVINNGDMSADITSAVTILQSISGMSYAIVWSGSTPVGNLSFEVSNDYSVDPSGKVNNPGTWNVAPVSVGGTTTTTIPISGNSGNGYIEILGTEAYASRIVYAAGSGTGSMTATVVGKVA